MARSRAVAQLVGCGPAGEVADEPGVHEVELGRLGEALADVGPERLKKADDSACLQDGNPRLHGLVVHVDGVRDVGRVEELACSCGCRNHEVEEFLLASQVDEIAHVPLQISLRVARPEALPGNVRRAEPRHRPALNVSPQIKPARAVGCADCRGGYKELFRGRRR